MIGIDTTPSHPISPPSLDSSDADRVHGSELHVRAEHTADDVDAKAVCGDR